MTENDADPQTAAESEPIAVADVLTAEDEIAVFAELEELKLRISKDEKRFKILRTEAGALIAVAGGTSGKYGEIVVMLRAGGPMKTFNEQKLLSMAQCCGHCGHSMFFPSTRVTELYDHSTRADSVEVSIAGSRGRKRP